MAWFTVSLVVVSLILMASEVAQPDMVMLGALVALMSAGVVNVSEATSGFAQPGLLTVMVLFAVTTGLERTGALEPLRRVILSRSSVIRTPVHELLLRFVPAVVATSAFLNNTPVVGILIPVVTELAAKAQLSPSKLLIPLSYAAVLGGTCTLVGTSTNLVVATLAEEAVMREKGEVFQVTFFEIGAVGLPVSLAGVLFLLLTAGPVLPARQPDDAAARAKSRGAVRPREYAVVTVIPRGSDFAGRCIGETELSSMPGIRVYRRMTRGETLEDPCEDGDPLRVGDVLCLSGIAPAIIDLLRVRGLRLMETHHHGALVHACFADDVGSPGASAPAAATPRASRELGRNSGGDKTDDGIPGSEAGDGSDADDYADATALASAEEGGASTITSAPPSPPAPRVPQLPSMEQLPAPANPPPPAVTFTHHEEDGSVDGTPVARRSSLRRGTNAVAAVLAGAAQQSQSWTRRFTRVDRTRLAEVVVGATGDLVGRTVSEVRFAERYRAAILAVQRRGDGTTTVLNMGSLRLRAGDGLLVACPPTFVDAHKDDASFALVADVAHYAPMRTSRAAVAVLLAVAMVAASAALREMGVTLLTAALVCVGAMMLCGCLTVEEARATFRLDLFLVIGAAFGVSTAMSNSGAASLIADILLMPASAGSPESADGDAGDGGDGSAGGPSLAAVVPTLFACTALLTEMITNNAAVAIMFPVVFKAHMAAPLALPLRPLVHTLMMAGSASFITPTGYQTNLMVYGPGGYRYLDFPRLGVPLQLLSMTTTCVVVLNPTWWWTVPVAATTAIVAWVAAMRVWPLPWYAPGRFRDYTPSEVGPAVLSPRMGPEADSSFPQPRGGVEGIEQLMGGNKLKGASFFKYRDYIGA